MFSELLSKSIDFDGSTSISALTMLVLQHDVPVLEEETLSLCEKQYEVSQPFVLLRCKSILLPSIIFSKFHWRKGYITNDY